MRRAIKYSEGAWPFAGDRKDGRVGSEAFEVCLKKGGGQVVVFFKN